MTLEKKHIYFNLKQHIIHLPIVRIILLYLSLTSTSFEKGIFALNKHHCIYMYSYL